jgi:hypothetical protein
MSPPRDRRGRFVKRKTRRNPFFEEVIIRPFVAAGVGHVAGRIAKAATDRVVKRRRKAKKR